MHVAGVAGHLVVGALDQQHLVPGDGRRRLQLRAVVRLGWRHDGSRRDVCGQDLELAGRGALEVALAPHGHARGAHVHVAGVAGHLVVGALDQQHLVPGDGRRRLQRPARERLVGHRSHGIRDARRSDAQRAVLIGDVVVGGHVLARGVLHLGVGDSARRRPHVGLGPGHSRGYDRVAFREALAREAARHERPAGVGALCGVGRHGQRPLRNLELARCLALEVPSALHGHRRGPCVHVALVFDDLVGRALDQRHLVPGHGGFRLLRRAVVGCIGSRDQRFADVGGLDLEGGLLAAAERGDSLYEDARRAYVLVVLEPGRVVHVAAEQRVHALQVHVQHGLDVPAGVDLVGDVVHRALGKVAVVDDVEVARARSAEVADAVHHDVARAHVDVVGPCTVANFVVDVLHEHEQGAVAAGRGHAPRVRLECAARVHLERHEDLAPIAAQVEGRNLEVDALLLLEVPNALHGDGRPACVLVAHVQ